MTGQMKIDPVRTRLKLPASYGAPTDSPLLEWSSVTERLQQAEHYWLSTADSNAIPMSRPLDGVWLDTAFYFGGDPATRWRRNLAENSYACLSVDDATNPVILEGSVSVTSLDSILAVKVGTATQDKYGWGSADQLRIESCVFTPIRAIAWMGLFHHATSFRFSN